jgi:hypothetical protein
LGKAAGNAESLNFSAMPVTRHAHSEAHACIG